MQDIIRERRSRDQWLDQAAHALFEAKKAEYPDEQPLPWDLVPQSVRVDFRYRAMAAHRLSLPLVRDVLVEMIAMAYANLEGWIYPDCDNQYAFHTPTDERPAKAAQRRQGFRHKARQILSSVWQYLEYDTDTEAQRKVTMQRVEGQLQADRMIVAYYRDKKGMPEAQHG